VKRPPLRCLWALTLALGCGALGGPGAKKPDPPPAPGPLLGASLADTLALVEAGDPGARVKLEVVRISSIDGDFWSDLPTRSVRSRAFRADPRTHYSMVAHRVCKKGWLDFRGGGLGSWFLFRGDSLVAFEHPGFQPDCEIIDHFVPAPLDQVREEREVRRYAGQRYPRVHPGPGERFQRGFAYLAVDRVEDAERMHRAGSSTLDGMIRSRKDREQPMDEPERALRQKRAELANALDEVRLEREGTEGPEEDYFRGLRP